MIFADLSCTTPIDRVTRLVDQLLTLSRLDSGQQLGKQNLDWQIIIHQAVVEHYARG